MISFLKKTGLLSLAWNVRRSLNLDSAGERALRSKFLQFKDLYGDAIRHRFVSPNSQTPRALIVSVGIPGIEVELGLIKAVEMAGYEPFIIAGLNEWHLRYYRLAQLQNVFFWEEFEGGDKRDEARASMNSIEAIAEFLAIKHAGIKVGRYATSTALRRLRTGSIDLNSSEVRDEALKFLAASMRSAVAARRIMDRVRPSLAVFPDRGYTPLAELFDLCMSQDVDTITWNAAHRNNTLMLKRYRSETRDDHPSSVSEHLWRELANADWPAESRDRLFRELRDSYASGEWYGEVGTQVNKRILAPDEIRARFKLDPARKTAVIFPHIFWDATFFWGTDLFENYEEWFVQTVQMACRTDKVNWLIKIHPANIIKNVRDGYVGEPSELKAIRNRIGELPRHVSLIPADSDLNTFSLFSVMDYCLTVRGTIGIEAGSFGVPVLTAGTGRYDGRGFTIDSRSREEYLQRVSEIHNLPPLSTRQRELAEKYAYAVFVQRPLRLKTVTLEYQQDARATLETQVNARTREDWLQAADMTVLAKWFAGREHDFFNFDSDLSCAESPV